MNAKVKKIGLLKFLKNICEHRAQFSHLNHFIQLEIHNPHFLEFIQDDFFRRGHLILLPQQIVEIFDPLSLLISLEGEDPEPANWPLPPDHPFVSQN